MHVLRSLLLVAASDTEALAVAGRGRPDAIVIDLEEGAPPEAVDVARAAANAAAERLAGGGSSVWIRIHSTETLQARADIQATLSQHVAGFVVPHVRSQNQMRYVDALLRDAERQREIKEGTTQVVAIIESAEGLLNAREIARAGARLAALALDGEDFCADMGVARTREGHELQYARGHIAVCARAANLLAIDTPYPFVRETQGFLTEVTAGRALGLHGKFALSAEQVTLVNAVFRPAAEEVAYARRLVEAHAAAEADGVAHLDGRLIDSPRARRARQIVELVTAIEARESQAAI